MQGWGGLSTALGLRTRGCSPAWRLYIGLQRQKEHAWGCTQRERSVPGAYQIAGTWALNRHLNRVHSRDGLLVWGMQCMGHSAAGCRQTLQDVQPRGDTETLHQLIAIALLLLKVDHEGWLLNTLPDQCEKTSHFQVCCLPISHYTVAFKYVKTSQMFIGFDWPTPREQP